MLTNTYRIITSIPLILVVLLSLWFTTKADRKQRRYRNGFLTSTLLMLVGNTLTYILTTHDAIILIFRLMVFLYAVNVGFFFLMTLNYFKLDRRMPKWIFPACYIYFLAALILVVTDSRTHFVFTDFVLLQSAPLMTYSIQFGVFYYVNAAICIAITLLITYLLISSYRYMPRAFRGSLTLFTLGPVCYSVGWILKIFIGHFEYNLVIFSSLICALCYSFSVQGSGVSELLQLQGREIFQYIDEGIFLLDKDGRILDVNAAARHLFHLDRQEQVPSFFDDLLQQMIDQNRLLIRPQDDQPGLDLCFLGGALPQFYLLERQPLETVNAIEGGKCIILKNRTNSRLIAERLRETAGVDVLTGLPNRYRYQELLRQLDEKQNLPLSILIGDVNGLKIVNDLYGHYEGDQLLKAAAKVLQFSCPSKGYVCRIGGDEFAVLLPNTDEHQLADLCTKMELGMKAFDFNDRQLSIALGGATKVSEDQNINVLIHLADKKMYKNKNEDR